MVVVYSVTLTKAKTFKYEAKSEKSPSLNITKRKLTKKTPK